MTAINPSRLSAALKQKFKTPRDALRALGLDENALGAPAPGGGGESDKLRSLRVDLEQLINDNLHLLDAGAVDKLLAFLDERVPLGNDPNASPGEDAEEGRAKFSDFLRKQGFSEDDIMKARDMLPKRGADRRPAMDARRSADFFAQFPDAARINSAGSLAMDAARRRARPATRANADTFGRLYPDASAIAIGAR